MGLERADDAGVYRLRDDLAIIQTVDFFTPIVDDPYLYGQISAANSLSDVYAMGGRPICAMNIACFPAKSMDISVLREILRGGLDKLREAEVALAGGHTVEDEELKYGLAVTGLVHPEKVLTNRGARDGDALVLTKPLGTGIINTAMKAEMAPGDMVDTVVATMASLNRKAAEVMASFEVHACTDVTGFGLLGHACEMIEDSDVGLILHSWKIPVFAGVSELCEMGLLPGGLHRNREFREAAVTLESGVPQAIADVLYDPQTSGGLLIALPGADASELVLRLHGAGISDAAVIGEVATRHARRILVKAD